MRDAIEFLKNYDFRGLADLTLDWAALSSFERYLAIKGVLLGRDYPSAERLLTENQEEFNSLGVLENLKLHLEIECSVDPSEAISRAMIELGRDTVHPFIHGERLFTVGWALLQAGSLDLAEEFLRRSIPPFEKAGLEAFAWRSRFNLALCVLNRGDHERFRTFFDILVRHFETLPDRTQVCLSRLIVWLHLHMDERERALTAISKYRKIAGSLCCPSEEAYLFKYEVYLGLKNGSELSLIGLESRGAGANSTEYDIISEMLWMSRVDGTLGFSEVERKVRSWSSRYNGIDAELLFDLLLHRLKMREDFGLIARGYETIRSQTAFYRPIIPAADFRPYALLAYRALNKGRAYEALKAEFLKSAPPWRVESYSVEEIAWSDRVAKGRIILDMGTRVLQFGEHCLDLRMRPRMLRFFEIVMKSSNGLRLNEFLEDDDRRDFTEFTPTSLRALCSRARKVTAEMGCFSYQDGVFSVRPGVVCVIRRRERGSGSRVRRQKIMEFVSEPRHRHGVSLRLLLKAHDFSRRTVQADLAYLCTKGKLVRFGKGKSVRYGLPHS